MSKHGRLTKSIPTKPRTMFIDGNAYVRNARQWKACGSGITPSEEAKARGVFAVVGGYELVYVG